MPEFSDYIETRQAAGPITGAEKFAFSQGGASRGADLDTLRAHIIADVVDSVTGDGVDNTDPQNPVITINPYTYPFPQFTTATSTTAYTGTTAPAITAYATGQKFQVKIHATSTGASTLNLNALGAKKVFTNPTTQATTDNLLIDQIYIFTYDAALDTAAGGFLMIGSGGGSGSGNVTKVGTPVNDQVGVWTGDGTIEGDAALTFDTITDKLSTVALNLSGLTASLPVRTDASKNLESRTIANFLSDLGINPIRVSVSVSAGTLTLDMDSKYRRKFLLGTQSSNFTIAFSNTTNAEEFDLDLAITGTVAITMPSTVRMQGYEVSNLRWVHSTKILTLIGTTASPFTITFRNDGTIFRCNASDPYVIA